MCILFEQTDYLKLGCLASKVHISFNEIIVIVLYSLYYYVIFNENFNTVVNTEEAQLWTFYLS